MLAIPCARDSQSQGRSLRRGLQWTRAADLMHDIGFVVNEAQLAIGMPSCQAIFIANLIAKGR